MPTINLHRQRYIVKNTIQKWRVYVDGLPVAKLPDDDVVSFVVVPGRHEVQVGGPTPFYPFAPKWMQSNLVIVDVEEGDVLNLRTAFHPLWNLSYRKPDFFHPSKCLILYSLNEESEDQLYRNASLLSEQYKNVLKEAHANKWDILAHVCCMLAFISLPIICKDSFRGLFEWFGFCFVAGMITLLSENKAYVLAGRNAFLGLTILLGYQNAYSNPKIAVGASIIMALFFCRYFLAYRHFKRMNELLKEGDYYYYNLEIDTSVR